jgi:hypothetical protein
MSRRYFAFKERLSTFPLGYPATMLFGQAPKMAQDVSLDECARLASCVIVGSHVPVPLLNIAATAIEPN